MAKQTRTYLTEAAAPIAEALAEKGKLKIVLSAGVIALNDLTPEQRDYYYGLAVGAEAEPSQIAEDKFRQRILEIVKEAQAIPVGKKSARRAKRPKAG